MEWSVKRFIEFLTLLKKEGAGGGHAVPSDHPPTPSFYRRGLFLVTILALAGCHPYEFTMGGPHVVSCEILTSLPGVDHDLDGATLRDTAAIDLSYFGATQYHLKMDCVLTHGEGFRILLRPVVEYRDVKDSGIIVTATEAGVSLDSGHHTFLVRPDVTVAPNQIVHVALMSENNYMQVVFDCDTIYRGWTKRNESDDVVVQALQGSEVQIIQPDWDDLPGREQ
jgi:hypothetical protein